VRGLSNRIADVNAQRGIDGGTECTYAQPVSSSRKPGGALSLARQQPAHPAPALSARVDVTDSEADALLASLRRHFARAGQGGGVNSADNADRERLGRSAHRAVAGGERHRSSMSEFDIGGIVD
jgi:hypothetical protein